MAVSAAFPGGIRLLEVNPRAYQRGKRSRWDATLKEEPYAPPFARLHLYDGGLYDNLGLIRGAGYRGMGSSPRAAEAEGHHTMLPERELSHSRVAR